jgi:uncharacterized protein (TIGR03437 family)
MCRAATVWNRGVPQALVTLALFASTADAQELVLDWRAIGNQSLNAASAGLASGPVDRVWFSADGEHLYARTEAGNTFETEDFETWKPSSAAPTVRSAQFDTNKWRITSTFRGESILGGGPADVALSPTDTNDVVIANQFGVWRTLDGGLSWNSLNESLPNLPAKRFLQLPHETEGTRILLGLPGVDGPDLEAEWRPGERTAWMVSESEIAATEAALADLLAPILGERPTRIVVSGSWVYVGGHSGRFWVSSDAGASWRPFQEPDGGAVSAIFVLPQDPRIAVAALSNRAGARVLRTMNGGLFWDDISANLPTGSAYGVTGDLESGTVYAATEAGLFYTATDLRSAGAASDWAQIGTGSGDASVYDVALDADGNQIYAAVSGQGIRRAVAPHRFRNPKLVSAADSVPRPAAPGALFSVLGSSVSTARIGGVDIPVLAASAIESQVQVPFAVSGSSLTLALQTSGGARNLEVSLQASSPAIFTDLDGAPILLDAERAILLDAATPARPGSTVQILATGLGRVDPEWPAGLAAPLESPPRVAAPVRVFLDRAPLEVTRATLAPGYVGFYLIEARLPDLVNAGPAELYIEAGPAASNRVTLHLAP